LGSFGFTFHVNGAVPPDTAKLAEYAVLRVAAGSDVVVMANVPALTVSVKDCVTGTPTPLDAVKVMFDVPAVVGVPERTPPENVTTAGRVPDSVMVGVGVPDAVGVNVLETPLEKVVEFAEVKAGAVPVPGTAVHVNLFASVELARNVTSVFQLSTGTPLELAQTIPAFQIPEALLPDPE